MRCVASTAMRAGDQVFSVADGIRPIGLRYVLKRWQRLQSPRDAFRQDRFWSFNVDGSKGALIDDDGCEIFVGETAKISIRHHREQGPSIVPDALPQRAHKVAVVPVGGAVLRVRGKVGGYDPTPGPKGPRPVKDTPPTSRSGPWFHRTFTKVRLGMAKRALEQAFDQILATRHPVGSSRNFFPWSSGDGNATDDGLELAARLGGDLLRQMD